MVSQRRRRVQRPGASWKVVGPVGVGRLQETQRLGLSGMLRAKAGCLGGLIHRVIWAFIPRRLSSYRRVLPIAGLNSIDDQGAA